MNEKLLAEKIQKKKLAIASQKARINFYSRHKNKYKIEIKKIKKKISQLEWQLTKLESYRKK